MSKKVCSKMCSDCPFSSNSMKGWLGGYSVEDLLDMVQSEQSFPCHQTVPYGMDTREAKKRVDEGRMRLCRGFVECMVKSAKLPRMNDQLTLAREAVKEEGVSEDSMNVQQFRDHHQPNP